MAMWVCTSGSSIPNGAIRAGYEADGRPLFIARAVMSGVNTPGKCAPHLDGAHIPWDSVENVVHHYEVLVLPVCSNGQYEWKKDSYGSVPNNAFRSDDDKYVGRACYSGSLIPGKIDTAYGHRCAYVSYGGKEIKENEYEVLCKVG